MHRKQHVTVSERIAEAKDWGTLQLLRGKNPPKQLSELERLFLLAARRHDDPAAQRFFSWVLCVCDDVVFAPYLQEDGGKMFWSHSLLSHSPVLGVNGVEGRAFQARVRKTTELCKKIPDFAPTQKERSKTTPMLLGTMKAMLTEVATRWRGTNSETEADELFNFLMYIGPLAGLDGEEGVWKIIHDVIREATGHFSANRLARHLAAASPASRCRYGQETLRILGIAWARNVEPSARQQVLAATEPLADSSLAAYELVRSYANQVAKLDEAARALKTVLGYQKSSLFHISENAEVSYSLPNKIEVRLEIWLSFRFPFNEGEGNRWLEAAMRNVCEVQAKFPYPVTLKVEVMRQGEKKAIFSCAALSPCPG